MIILDLLLSCFLALLSMAANVYVKKYGGNSSMLAIPYICAGLAIYLAFMSGGLHGRQRQQEAITEAMNKQQEAIVAQMKEFNAKLRAKESAEGQ